MPWRSANRPAWSRAAVVFIALATRTLVPTPAAAEPLPEPGSDLAVVGELARSAERIFRGRCVSASDSHADVAGGRFPITIYEFTVGEHLKGDRTATVTFRQIGRREGGPRDLGQRVGLPTYDPGTEYVLFLLPEGGTGLTSPAGAGEAAFEVRGDRLLPIGGRHGSRRLSRRGSLSGEPGTGSGDLALDDLAAAVRRAEQGP